MFRLGLAFSLGAVSVVFLYSDALVLNDEDNFLEQEAKVALPQSEQSQPEDSFWNHQLEGPPLSAEGPCDCVHDHTVLSVNLPEVGCFENDKKHNGQAIWMVEPEAGEGFDYICYIRGDGTQCPTAEMSTSVDGYYRKCEAWDAILAAAEGQKDRLHQEQTGQRSEMFLILDFWIPPEPGPRRDEIVWSFYENMKAAESVILFVSPGDQVELEEHLPPGSEKKIRVVEKTYQRVMYGDVEKLGVPHGSIMMYTEMDMWIPPQTFAAVRTMELNGTALAVTRWDYKHTHNHEHKNVTRRWQIFEAQDISQDLFVWLHPLYDIHARRTGEPTTINIPRGVMRSVLGNITKVERERYNFPEPQDIAGFGGDLATPIMFLLRWLTWGLPADDNLFVFYTRLLGYNVLNPCKFTRTFHIHSADSRPYMKGRNIEGHPTIHFLMDRMLMMKTWNTDPRRFTGLYQLSCTNSCPKNVAEACGAGWPWNGPLEVNLGPFDEDW